MLNILFVGDINGKIGREAVKKILPDLKKKLKIDLVIANAENIAHGSGVTERTLTELMEVGVDYFTCGDHAFDRDKDLDVYNRLPILRPANYSKDAPGQGHVVIKHKNKKILLINLIGRVFMRMDYDCPFAKFDEILGNLDLDIKNISAIITDMHAEATSEKIAFGHYADGKISAMLGTHTHVMTADNKITENGMGYITDVGMAGLANGCIGLEKKSIIETFKTQIKHRHILPETGKAIFNAVNLHIDTKTGKTIKLKPVTKTVEIK